jgi:hypothetical protein
LITNIDRSILFILPIFTQGSIGNVNLNVCKLLDERHLLECLYNFIVPKTNSTQTRVPVGDDHNGILHQMTSKFRGLLSQKSGKANINLPIVAQLHRRGVKFSPFTWASVEIRFDRASST